MLSLRLKAISEEIADNQKVIDIGTDHAYLPIYLVSQRGFTQVYATDISPAVLQYSEKNIAKYHLEKQIKLILSDGLDNITENFDTIVIAGLGAYTIINILKKAPKLAPNIIIQSNNNLPIIRTFMNAINYQIKNEKVVLEKGKYYVIINYQKGKEKLTQEQIMFGKSNDKKYLLALLNKYQKIYLKNQDQALAQKITKLTKFIEKISD